MASQQRSTPVLEKAVRHLRPLYGNSEAKEFGPNKLTIVREILQGIAACVFDIHPASSDEFVNFIELTDLPQLTAAFTDGDGGHPSPVRFRRWRQDWLG